MNIAIAAFISQSTFYSIQKKLLYPAIHRVYTTNRALLFEGGKEESEIQFLGDGVTPQATMQNTRLTH